MATNNKKVIDEKLIAELNKNIKRLQELNRKEGKK